MYCYFCGKENKDDQKFCKYCGKSLYVLSIENDTIEENNIHEQENDFNNKKEWYTDIDDIVTGALYIEPTEPTDDSAISGYRDHVKEIVSMKNKDIHRYEIFTEDITWTEAYEKCRQMGGYLARIDTEEENDHICRHVGFQSEFSIGWAKGFREAIERLEEYAEKNGQPVYFSGLEEKILCHYTL